MKRSLCISMAAGLAAAAVPALAQQTMIFTTGRPDPVTFNGTNNTSLGWSSGNLSAAQPQRWSAQMFTIPAGGATIGQIDGVGFVATAFDTLNWKIWNRRPGTTNPGWPAPLATDEVPGGSGSVPWPSTTLGVDDPTIDRGFVGGNDTYKIVLPTPITLPAGDYYLSLYATNVSGAAANWAWFANPQPDPVFYSPLNTPIYQTDNNPGAYMWRANTYPVTGFARYDAAGAVLVATTPTWGPDPQSPNYLFGAAFRLLTPPPIGACCANDGSCSIQNSTACQLGGGTFRGAGTVCGQVNCNGACCAADGTCSNVTANACSGSGGTFNGIGTTCATSTCVGACCRPDGTCAVVTPAVCSAADGLFNGLGSTCANVTCRIPGACCQTDGTCSNSAYYQCARNDGAIYRGDGTSCPNTCLQTGACCKMDGTCVVVTEAVCRGAPFNGNGLYRGAGTTCAAANCPTTYTYAGQPVDITDAPAGTTNCGPQVFAEITVTDSFTLGNADVSMFVTHTFQGDLNFWLKHVQTGTMVQVVNQPSRATGTFFGADDFGNPNTPNGWFRLIDSAPDFYRTPPAPLDGINGVHYQWKPENALAAFAGQNSAGQWQLVAQDCGPADVGQIFTWAVTLHRPGPAVCYANCDNSTAIPFLNVGDFTCFLQKYTAGDPYANCDGSTTQPVLNVADFTCFLQKYTAGCSAP